MNELLIALVVFTVQHVLRANPDELRKLQWAAVHITKFSMTTVLGLTSLILFALWVAGAVQHSAVLALASLAMPSAAVAFVGFFGLVVVLGLRSIVQLKLTNADDLTF